MATIIKHKRSNTPGAVPEVEDLAEGEIAINTADGKLFITKGANEEKEVVTIISDAVSRSEQTLNETEKAQVRANIGVSHTFNSVAALLADEMMSYTAGSGLIEVGPGDIIEAQGFRYEVAASDATDAHVETAGGVKLYEAGPLFTSIDRMARSNGTRWAVITTGLRAGSFSWSGADLSAEVLLDPERGIYVAPASDPTGASGAWVRQFEGAARFEWWGADNTGLTPTSAAIQAAVSAALDLGIEDFDATGARFNMTGGMSDIPLNPGFTTGAAVIALKDGGTLRVKGGYFFSTDDDEETSLFLGVLLKELQFADSAWNRSFAPNMDTEYFSDRQHCISAYGVALLKVTNSQFESVKGDGVYAARDWVSPAATNRDCGTVSVHDCEFVDIKRNGVAATSVVNASFKNNRIIGRTGGTWYRSGALTIEPNQHYEAIGRIIMEGNIAEGFGFGRGLKVHINPNKIPTSLYEAVIISNNIVDCDIGEGIFVDARGVVDEISICGNAVKGVKGVGILISDSAKMSVISNNLVISEESGFGIYWSKTTGRENISVGVASGNVVRRATSGLFRGVFARVDTGSYITVIGNQVFAVDSTLQPIYLDANVGTGKAKTLIASGNSGAGFSQNIVIDNAEKAIAVGNGFAVTGVNNTSESFANNL